MKAITLLALLLAAGCSKDNEAHAPVKPAPEKAPPPVVTPTPKPTSPVPSTPPVAPAPIPAPNPDLALTVAVREAVERQASLNDIQVTVNEGDVTLTGTVATAEEKDAAGAAARGVPGVRTVDNQLTIKG